MKHNPFNVGDARPATDENEPPGGNDLPCHDALALTGGGALALITLGDQTYTLRITRAQKLILTK